MLRVTVLELPARWNGRAEALAETDALLARGATDLVVLPELAFDGYVSARGEFDRRRCAEPAGGPTEEAVRVLAKRHCTHVVAPFVWANGEQVHNALVVVSPTGERIVTYAKRHPWYPETWADPGTSPYPVFAIGDLAVTAAICFDVQFLTEDGADALARADLVVFTSAWVDDENTRIPLLRRLARRHHVAVANANWGARRRAGRRPRRLVHRGCPWRRGGAGRAGPAPRGCGDPGSRRSHAKIGAAVPAHDHARC